MVRTTKQLRTAPGDKWAKISSMKFLSHPATPGIMVVGGTGQTAAIAGTDVTTGLTTVLGVSAVVNSPVTPTMTAEITCTPLANGSVRFISTPATTVNWIAFGL